MNIMHHCERNDFLALRRASAKMKRIAENVNSHWMDVLRDIAPRRITDNSVHYPGYACNELDCRNVQHYDYDTLELKLLKTIPLWEQAMRLHARFEVKWYKRQRKRYYDRSVVLEDAAHDVDRKFERSSSKMREAKRILDSYGGNTRKRRRINHESVLY
jgi:hypothetical protein